MHSRKLAQTSQLVQVKALAGKRQSFSVLAGTLTWLVLAGGLYTKLLNYEGKAGPMANPPLQYPAGAPAVQKCWANSAGSNTDFNLIMFVHPKCPCTQASITELKVLLHRCANLKATVYFVDPPHVASGFEKTSLWSRLKNSPKTTLLVDKGGEIARCFNATTSGECMLYSQDGKLLFAGGLTSGRGHEGDNSALDTICALVKTENNYAPKVRENRMPVFGCSLLSKQCNK